MKKQITKKEGKRNTSQTEKKAKRGVGKNKDGIFTESLNSMTDVSHFDRHTKE